MWNYNVSTATFQWCQMVPRFENVTNHECNLSPLMFIIANQMVYSWNLRIIFCILSYCFFPFESLEATGYLNSPYLSLQVIVKLKRGRFKMLNEIGMYLIIVLVGTSNQVKSCWVYKTDTVTTESWAFKITDQITQCWRGQNKIAWVTTNKGVIYIIIRDWTTRKMIQIKSKKGLSAKLQGVTYYL